MEPWTGAVLVGPDIRWRVILIAVAQLGNGSWVYTYSVRPGANVSLVVAPGPDMIGPHDDLCAELARGLGDALPAART